MNIVVPMAGRGARFSGQGYETPKPFIEIAGRPMFYWALKSLNQVPYSRIIFVALQSHEHDYKVSKLIEESFPEPFELILLDDVTEGQLCTVLAARKWIAVDDDLLIASADTYVVSNLGSEIALLSPDVHGLISVADMPGDHWSFARTDESGRVVEVAEKIRISNHASTGLYYFSNGREFVELADQIIADQEKTRGEYYVIPVYQKYLQRHWQVKLSLSFEMWDMGNPAALQIFQKYIERL